MNKPPAIKRQEERFTKVILTEKNQVAKEYIQRDIFYVKFSEAWETKQYGNVYKHT